MRAFIAIPLPEAVLSALALWQESLRSVSNSSPEGESIVKWVRPEGIHLTLRFLGEINAAKVEQVITALTPLGNFPALTLEVKGLGCFPNCEHPRVLWAGVIAPRALPDFAAKIEAALSGLGFPSEKRSFSPHLTLARFGDGCPQPWVKSAVRESNGRIAGQFEVSEFCLFESQLMRGAPARYRRVASFSQKI